MPRKRRRQSGNTNRRRFLLKFGLLGAGAISAGKYVRSTGAFSSVTASRSVTAEVASADNAIIGIVGQGPVQKNKQEAMVEFINNSPQDVEITVTLDNPGDGTLYSNQNTSGASSVTVSVSSGGVQTVDIVADISGSIPYDVNVGGGTSSSLSLTTSRSVQSEGGNANTGVRVQLQKFRANAKNNKQGTWELKKTQAQDRDGDDDLQKVKWEITDSNGTIRATRKDTFAVPKPKYRASRIDFSPNNNYSIQSGETYTITVTVTDVDGNFGSETLTDVA